MQKKVNGERVCALSMFVVWGEREREGGRKGGRDESHSRKQKVRFPSWFLVSSLKAQIERIGQKLASVRSVLIRAPPMARARAFRVHLADLFTT